MKLLLIRPPIFCSSLQYPSGPKFGIPLGILYLAAACEKQSISVEIYDALIDFDWENITLNSNNNYHIGASWNTIGEKVKESQADIVGISNPFSDYAEYAVLLAKVVRETLPDARIIVGGPHATSDPESFLYSGSPVDIVSRGEGEVSFPLLVEALENKTDLADLPGISYKKDGETVHTPAVSFMTALDELPLPAYHLIPMERYFTLVKAGYPSRYTFEYPRCDRELSMVTSRGCPYKCTFCGNFQHMGRKWRCHSIPNIKNHMKLCIENYGIQHFHIEDDNLSLNRKRFESFLDMIIEQKWNITWDTPNGIRAEGFTDEIVQKIVKSGCTYIIVGVESGNQRVLKELVKKNLDLTKVVEAAKLSHKHKLPLHAFFIIGFPGETLGEIDETLQFAWKLLLKYNVIPHIGIAHPLPGTELYEICKINGWLTDPIRPDLGNGIRSEVYEREMIETPDFTPNMVENRLSQFTKKMISVILLKTALWFMFHPIKMITIFNYFFRQHKEPFKVVIKRLFFGGMFYKENYYRISLKSDKNS